MKSFSAARPFLFISSYSRTFLSCFSASDTVENSDVESFTVSTENLFYSPGNVISLFFLFFTNGGLMLVISLLLFFSNGGMKFL